MRCDGNDVCASCQSVGSACQYPVSATPSIDPGLSSHADIADGGNPDPSLGDYGVSIGNNEQTSSLPFTMQNSGLDQESSLNTTTDSLQGTNHDGLALAFQEDITMPIYDTVTRNEPSLAHSQDIVPYPLLEAGNMDDFWQIPAMVCTAGHILFRVN
jgi:hypothetical protein